MRNLSRLNTSLGHGMLIACCLPAVGAAQTLPVGRQEPAIVYIERFHAEPGNGADDFAQFAQQFIRFELAKAPQLRPVGLTLAPTCRTSSAFDQKGQTAPSAEFFTVRGSVDAAADSGFVLDVEISQCASGLASRVLHQSRLFRVKTATSELQSLASNVSDRIVGAGLPTFTVVVVGSLAATSKPQTQSTRYSLRDRIVSAVLETGAAKLVDSAQADFTLTVEPQGQASSPASFRVRFASNRQGVDTLSVARGTYSADQHLDQVAVRSAQRLDELIHLPGLRVSGTSAPSRDSAIGRARRSLCLGAPPSCRPTPEIAVVALKALPNTSNDVDVLTLRGRADLAQGNFGSALDELRRADSIRVVAPGRAPIPEASAHDLRMSIADVYRAAGNHPAAIREYAQLLKTTPRDSTAALLMIQSLRLSGHRLAALDSSVRGMSRFPGFSAMRDEATSGVRDIAFDLSADSLTTLITICQRDAQIQRACANSLADHAADGGLDGDASARVRAFLRASSQLGRNDPTTAVRRNIALAMSFIGHPEPVEAGGVLMLRSQEFQRDSVAFYLALADSSMNPAVSDTTRERLHRARAYHAGLTGDYLQGLSEAERGYHTLANRDDALLGTLLATILASHARAPAATPGRDEYAQQWTRAAQTTARALIDSAANRFRDDEPVLIARARFCSDYAIDHRCSFEANSLRMSKGMVHSNLDILDAVESAIVVDQYATALDWLKTAAPGSLSGCTLTVAGLYQTWASAATGLPAYEAFAKWKTGIEQYRGSNEWKCWVFEGAKARLGESPPVPNAAVLQAMILAFEDRAAPIPNSPLPPASRSPQ